MRKYSKVGRVLTNAGKMSEAESTQPNESKIKTLSSMTVAELKKYLQMRCVTVNGYLKPALLEIAQAVEKMMLPVEPTNEYSNEGSSEDTFIINDIVIRPYIVL